MHEVEGVAVCLQTSCLNGRLRNCCRVGGIVAVLADGTGDQTVLQAVQRCLQGFVVISDSAGRGDFRPARVLVRVIQRQDNIQRRRTFDTWAGQERISGIGIQIQPVA